MGGLSAALLGAPIGRAAVAIAVLAFLRWLIPFVFQRIDIARGVLGKRLDHLEAELDAYREATMLMINVVAKLDPKNPALITVARILRMSPPRSTIALDELEARLNAGEVLQ